mgnify:CR=1 FL=1
MDIELTAEQARIVGALMEKEVTTPDYYPMTLNALVNACNQKSCREPVMQLDEATASFHLDILRDDKRLVALVSAAVSRVPKFKQRLTETYFFTPPERAVLCELMLRGPQTPGELRNRAERMFAFSGIEQVSEALKELEHRPDGPWVVLLPRLPGHKEARYMHLLCGQPKLDEAGTSASEAVVTVSGVSPTERIARLEEQTAQLSEQLAQLTADFAQFRRQFET